MESRGEFGRTHTHTQHRRITHTHRMTNKCTLGVQQRTDTIPETAAPEVAHSTPELTVECHQKPRANRYSTQHVRILHIHTKVNEVGALQFGKSLEHMLHDALSLIVCSVYAYIYTENALHNLSDLFDCAQ